MTTKQESGNLRIVAIIVVLLVGLFLRPGIELGIITLVRRGVFPPLWIAILLVALNIASFVLGEIAGSLRGRYYAMEYSNHEQAEQLFGAKIRLFAPGHLIAEAAHIIVFLVALVQSVVLLVNGS